VLVGGFAAVAVLLAAIGIYAVVAQTVGRRTREIGTRMALGACRRDVIVMILRQSGTTTAAGITAGLAGAAALARSLEGMLFGVTPVDPLTFVAVPLLFMRPVCGGQPSTSSSAGLLRGGWRQTSSGDAGARQRPPCEHRPSGGADRRCCLRAR
jgi:hypothetical protein